MNAIAHLPIFLLAAAMMILVPGPATLFVAGQLRQSCRSAWLATLGIVAGDILLISMTGLAVNALVHTWPVLLDVIKVAGGLYLAFSGLAMYNSPAPEPEAVAAPAGLLQGFFLTLTNPKPILFFAAFFPLFIEPGAGSLVQSFYFLGALYETLNVFYLAALVALLARAPRRMPLHRLSAVGLMLCSVFVLTA